MNEYENNKSLNRGISPMILGRYISDVDSYISQTIILEKKMRMATMDVFGRLKMARIIFLDVPIDDVANIIQAQLLFLASTDEKTDSSLCLNTLGGSVSAGFAMYDTMQIIKQDV